MVSKRICNPVFLAAISIEHLDIIKQCGNGGRVRRNHKLYRNHPHSCHKIASASRYMKRSSLLRLSDTLQDSCDPCPNAPVARIGPNGVEGHTRGPKSRVLKAYCGLGFWRGRRGLGFLLGCCEGRDRGIGGACQTSSWDSSWWVKLRCQCSLVTMSRDWVRSWKGKLLLRSSSFDITIERTYIWL